VTPAIIPDLFTGDSLRLMGRFTGARSAIVTVRGLVNGRPASLPVRVSLSDAPSDARATTSAMPIVWARAQVADLMRDYASPAQLRAHSLNESDIQERVTQLGLDYALVTDWTSFVAVSRRIVNADPGASRDADVPLPMPAGVGPNAYGELMSAAQFGGASTPEPGFMALVALSLLLIVAAMRRRLTVRESEAG
jgi:Ca-activated chloride channel family protein